MSWFVMEKKQYLIRIPDFRKNQALVMDYTNFSLSENRFDADRHTHASKH